MRLRRLFIRIFLWFWLAMALVIVGLFFSIFITERREAGPPWRGAHSALMGFYAQSIAEVFERDGRDALISYLERIERSSDIRTAVFNQDGVEITGRDIPDNARELAARAAQTGMPEFLPPYPPSHFELLAQTVRSPLGRQFVIVAELPAPPPPPLHRPFSNLKRVALQLFAVLVIGGLFCYWLARYVTTPIIKLRAATQELASGNLGARVGTDLTKQRDEVGHLGRDFNVMAERMESLVASQRRLLGDISHELRSPLARLGVALALARRHAPGEEAGAMLDRIGREAESINEMIGQLLTLSRAESGTDGWRNMEVDLRALVQEIADDADFEARSRNRRVRASGMTACTITGVPSLIKSAIENVVRNAARYTAEETQVEISLTCEQPDGDRGWVVINVRDHGTGVPEEAIEKIFRPFYRVEDARDRQSGGSGLGLAIAARAVRLHGGSLSAANATDGGLIVEMRLPLKWHPQDYASASESPSKASSGMP
ncbi:MAG TPA: ATP-binding protein [Pyrinomonadaceae bacterium]|nr:ATP-binding protein [Pyrinomonadaceae bacterium]